MEVLKLLYRNKFEVFKDLGIPSGKKQNRNNNKRKKFKKIIKAMKLVDRQKYGVLKDLGILTSNNENTKQHEYTDTHDLTSDSLQELNDPSGRATPSAPPNQLVFVESLSFTVITILKSRDSTLSS